MTTLAALALLAKLSVYEVPLVPVRVSPVKVAKKQKLDIPALHVTPLDAVPSATLVEVVTGAVELKDPPAPVIDGVTVKVEFPLQPELQTPSIAT